MVKPVLLGPDGRPIERAVLAKEIAYPTELGVRAVHREGVASGMTPEGLAALLRDAAADGRLASLRALNASFPYDTEEARLAYAQSLSVVDYILDTYGTAGMARLIAVFREGISYDDAVRRALGLSLDELDRRWRADLAAQTGDLAAGLDTSQATLLASGAFFMAIAALLALLAGARSFLRARRLPPDPLDAEA